MRSTAPPLRVTASVLPSGLTARPLVTSMTYHAARMLVSSGAPTVKRRSSLLSPARSHTIARPSVAEVTSVRPSAVTSSPHTSPLLAGEALRDPAPFDVPGGYLSVVPGSHERASIGCEDRSEHGAGVSAPERPNLTGPQVEQPDAARLPAEREHAAVGADRAGEVAHRVGAPHPQSIGVDLPRAVVTGAGEVDPLAICRRRRQQRASVADPQLAFDGARLPVDAIEHGWRRIRELAMDQRNDHIAGVREEHDVRGHEWSALGEPRKVYVQPELARARIDQVDHRALPWVRGIE